MLTAWQYASQEFTRTLDYKTKFVNARNRQDKIYFFFFSNKTQADMTKLSCETLTTGNWMNRNNQV